MPNLLSDLLPWEASTVLWNARAKFLEDFWDSQEEFDLAMRCTGAEQLVNPKLMQALRLCQSDAPAALLFLRDAKRALEEFATSSVPDEFLKQARDEYLEAAEMEHGS